MWHFVVFQPSKCKKTHFQPQIWSIWPIFPNDSESLPKVCYIKQKNSEILSKLRNSESAGGSDQRQNDEQTPASKSCLNFNFKILTNPCAQSLNKSLALEPNVSSQICNKLLPTLSSASTSTTVTTSTSFELPSSHTRVTSNKFTKRQSVS